MKITTLEKSKDNMQATLLLEGVAPAYANTLRRLMINRVPTMAIEEVEFKRNDSALYDEMIAHRLGLICLTTDLSAYDLPSKAEEGAEDSARYRLKLSLKAKGPKTVYAEDLQSNDPKVAPVYPKTPIVKLLKGQNLEFEATAILGTGKQHAKWSPGHVFYKHKADIKIDEKKLDDAQRKEVVASCPVNVFESKGSKIDIPKENLLKCTLCNNCVAAAPDAVKVDKVEDAFVFTIESWGQLTAPQIVEESIKVFDEILDDFTVSIKG